MKALAAFADTFIAGTEESIARHDCEVILRQFDLMSTKHLEAKRAYWTMQQKFDTLVQTQWIRQPVDTPSGSIYSNRNSSYIEFSFKESKVLLEECHSKGSLPSHPFHQACNSTFAGERNYAVKDTNAIRMLFVDLSRYYFVR